MKERLNVVKEYLAKINRRTKIIAAIVAAIIVVGAIVITLILNHKDYVVLFSDVTEEETTQILAKLQEMNVEYKSDRSGNIRVPENVADTTRAQLAQEGYPKSGFTYDVFTQNAGGMTTDMEKQTYKLYELQNRIGATVRLFEGVKDAKVTIALGEENKYVLSDAEDASSGPSASVVMMMENGGSPTESQAVGVQRLVAQSVPDMKMENVTVLDGNGIIVSDIGDSAGSSDDASQEILRIIESQLTQKVIHVLEPFYGADNVRVSAKGTVNMEKIIRESTTYTTPEKIDEEDKTGILSKETGARETSGGGNAAGGVVGTETNSDISQYTANATQNGNGYTSESWTRDFLVNQIKEQGEIDSGVLQDVTVSVAINGRTLGDLTTNKLMELVGNAVGIAPDDRIDKITIANAPFYEGSERENRSFMEQLTETVKDNLLFVIIGIVVLLLLVTALIIFLRKRKKAEDELEEVLEEELAQDVPVDEEGMQEEEEDVEPLDLVSLKNERSQQLRDVVRAFAEENPEISAQMLKNWLRGGENSDE